MDAHDDPTVYAITVPPEKAKSLTPPRININGSVDEFYRYKMSALVCCISNAHASKMVKTTLANMDTVSANLQRPPSYLTNFIGYSLSAKCEYNAKKPEGENAYISGNLTEGNQLSDLVRAFIKDWVLCPKCNNPEINLVVKNKKGGNGTIKLECSACGYRGKLKSSIMEKQPKMCAHVFTHPPKKKAGTQKIEDSVAKTQKEPDAVMLSKGKKGKKDKKKDGEGGASPKKGEGGASPLAAEEEPAAEPEPEATPQEKLSALVQGEGSDEELRALHKKLSKGMAADTAVPMLLEAMSSAGPKPFIKGFKTYKKSVSKAVGEDAEAISPAVLAWFEGYGAANIEEPKLLAKALHTMYEADIVEEEAVLAWHATKHEAGSAPAQLRQAVQAIIDWLQEADSDDDDEDED